MKKDSVIVITGAAGFIGSVLAAYLQKLGFERLILVDDFSKLEKTNNLFDKSFEQKVHREQFFEWLQQHPGFVNCIFHLGARTDTTESNPTIFKELNLRYSREIWEYCAEQQIPLVYASSAATYGDGALGYDDDESVIPQLKPLNAYAVSKQKFDEWVLVQKSKPPFWAGLKFFNVYGPNEYHKGRMASVIFHAFNQIKHDGWMKLFKSHKREFVDGGQQRDFIYVMDVVKVCVWMMAFQPESGIYNLGTGQARSFNDLSDALFESLQKTSKVHYIDIPEDIREAYQYFTEAEMDKLRKAGYEEPFMSLEEGIKDYVQNYLQPGKYY